MEIYIFLYFRCKVISQILTSTLLLLFILLILTVVKGVQNYIFLKIDWKFCGKNLASLCNYHISLISLVLVTFKGVLAIAIGPRNWSIHWRGGGIWGGGYFTSKRINLPVSEGARVRLNDLGGHIYLLIFCSNRNSDKLWFVTKYVDLVFCTDDTQCARIY